MKKETFNFILKSGHTVEVIFTPFMFGNIVEHSVHHFEFKGKTISETGYQSYFMFRDELFGEPGKVSSLLAQQLEDSLILRNSIVINKIEQLSMF